MQLREAWGQINGFAIEISRGGLLAAHPSLATYSPQALRNRDSTRQSKHLDSTAIEDHVRNKSHSSTMSLLERHLEQISLSSESIATLP